MMSESQAGILGHVAEPLNSTSAILHLTSPAVAPGDSRKVEFSLYPTASRRKSIAIIPNISMIAVVGSGTVVEVAESGATMP